MAQASVFTFDFREVTTALIRQQGLHEGHWMISLEFAMAAGVFGISAEEPKPSAMLQVRSIQLVRATADQTETHGLVVDASEVNARAGS